MRRLPTLASLRAFEAAGRAESFSRAAEELHVTPTAISHQVRALEEWMGVRLFERSTRKVRLTEAGRGYFPAVRDAFDSLVLATERIARHTDDGVLTITTTTSFMTKWLIPRLADFQRQHPEIDLRITSSITSIDLLQAGVDAGIRYGGGTWPGVDVTRLLSEHIFPVCSPALLAGDRPLGEPSDLAHHPLLHVSAQPDDWRLWLTGAGVEGVDPTRGTVFDVWIAALQAAADGYGVALGHTPLVAADLAAGRLVKPFDFDLPGDFAYYLVTPSGVAPSPALTTFRTWLCAVIRE